MLKFIGSGNAFNTRLGNNSAYIKKIDNLFLIDCGGTTFDRLQYYGLLEGINSVYVLITHTHPDHIASLGDLIFYGAVLSKFKTTVIFPDKDNIKLLLSLMGVSPELYRLVAPGEFNEMGLVTLPMTSIHVKEINAYGYIIQSENGLNIFYSGDSGVLQPEITKLLQEGKLDMVYQDACSYDIPGNVHMYLGSLAEAVPLQLRGKVWCMHLDKDFDSEEAEALGFNVVRNDF